MALRLYWGWSLLWLTCVHVRVCVCVFMPIYLTENESVSYLVMSNSATA